MRRLRLSSDLLTLQVIDVNGPVTNIDAITSIVLKLADGSMIGLRPGHAPLIGALDDGQLRYVRQGTPAHLPVKAGILTVYQNKVKILTTAL